MLFPDRLSRFLSAVIALGALASLGAATYYVDNAGGNDANSGASSMYAWKTLSKVNATTFVPGDRIRLRAGSSWSEQLAPKGSGTDASPIVLDSFGFGALPLIAVTTSDVSLERGWAVRLSNQEGWDIRNLEITNANGRLGVMIHKNVPGTKTHIGLHNLIIHNVNGPREARQSFPTNSRYYGGILLFDSTWASPGRYDKVTIDSCTVYDVQGMGIQFSQPPHDNALAADKNYCGTNFIIRGNTIHDCKQDGMVVRCVVKALIEYNVVYHNGVPNTQYLAGLWIKYADSTIVQYCEVYNTIDNHNALDGCGFDFDYDTWDCILQYSYSHNNSGGFFLTMDEPAPKRAGRNVVRYNLSIDDSTRIFKIGGPGDGTNATTGYIYNNTIIQNAGINCPDMSAFDAGGVKKWVMKNNIFYLNHTINYSTGSITYDYNCYAGSSSTTPPSGDAHKVVGNPMFVNVAAKGAGLGVLDNFMIQSGSPCLNTGTTNLTNMLNAMPADKWGNAFDVSPNIGMHQGVAGSINASPTVAIPAAASPSPVTGKTTSLSVMGADDGGESNLVYFWTTRGTPPATVTFSASGTNAAKNVTATFTKAGTYGFQVSIQDQQGRAVLSNIDVMVSQVSTGVTVTPATASVSPGATLQFAAVAVDQFGAALSSQPAFAWTVGGGGTVSAAGLFTAGTTAGGPYTVTATSGGKSGTASVTITSGSMSALYSINCGGAAVAPFVADQYFSGGTVSTVTNTITTSGVTNPAPMSVYQSERYGNFTYTIGSLAAGSPYTVKLHFAETYWTAAGSRTFNVSINGTQVLSAFDVFVAAGGMHKAIVQTFSTSANASRQVVIQFTTVKDNAKISGIEILGGGGPANSAPTVSAAASASPSSVSGTTSALSALGADDAGEPALTYTWAATSQPSGASVAFSANATNAAKSTVATFNRAGSYTLKCTIRDVPGLTTTSSVNVTVSQMLTTVMVSPATASVAVSGTQQFTAMAADQFAQSMSATFAWTISGGGTISAAGLFTAGTTAGGPYTVTATSGGKSGTASVTVTAATTNPVSLLDAWIIGTTHTKVAGANRALVVLVYGERASLNMSVSAVTYGGQTMTKVVEKNQGAAARSYTAAFILPEAGVNAASSATIAITWGAAPDAGKSDVVSVLLKDVNQSTLTGATATGGSDNATSVSTTTSTATASGDLVIVGGTGASQGTFGVSAGYTKGLETTIPTWGDAVAGHKSATGASETPGVTMSASMRLSVLGFVVKK